MSYNEYNADAVDNEQDETEREVSSNEASARMLIFDHFFAGVSLFLGVRRGFNNTKSTLFFSLTQAPAC